MCYKCSVNTDGLKLVERRILYHCGHIDQDRNGKLVWGVRTKEKRVDNAGRIHILDYNTCSECCPSMQQGPAWANEPADLKKAEVTE